MKLKFLVEEKYVFLSAFNQIQQNEPFQGWSSFTLDKWDKYPQECYFLAGFAEWPLLSRISLKTLAIKSEKLLKDWLKSPEVKKLIEETIKYRDWLEEEWEKKGTKSLLELENIIRMPLPEQEISVYITHPNLRNGMALNSKIIVWGHSEDWLNYSIVYLCHEIMHILFWNEKSNRDIVHAVIELAVDNELRIRLNKKGQYFQEDRLRVGHQKLRKIERELLPFWKKYLNNPNINLKDFIQERSKRRK